MALRNRPYENAATLVFDPVATNRIATRASLHALGFRGVDLAPSIEVFEERLRLSTFDLVLAEAAGTESDVCRLVEALRLGRIGVNPFTIAIVTTWRRDTAFVGQVVNSGADDLIARPFSTTLLGERIRLLAEKRKRFVVTSDYVGPDRRRDPGRADSAPTMEVPNTLRLRMEDRSYVDTESEIESQLARAKTALNGEKMKRDAVQLLWQQRLLESRKAQTPEFSDALGRIQTIAAEIAHRAARTPKAEVAELCQSAICVVDAITLQIGQMDDAPGRSLDLTPLMHALGRTVGLLGSMLAPGESLPAPVMGADRRLARAG